MAIAALTEKTPVQVQIGHSKFISLGVPWTLAYSEAFENLQEAKKRELSIKKMKSRKYIEALIAKGRASRLTKWAGHLKASGRAARWNSNGYFMLYAASTRALACLENMVHRRSIGADDLFRVTLIEIPDDLKVKKIDKEKLPANWQEYINYTLCQSLGDVWLKENKTAVLQVPSAIIPEEYNYLLNPQHPDFSRIRMRSIEKFKFDERLLK